jgi:hypothetical protein
LKFGNPAIYMYSLTTELHNKVLLKENKESGLVITLKDVLRIFPGAKITKIVSCNCGSSRKRSKKGNRRKRLNYGDKKPI